MNTVSTYLKKRFSRSAHTYDQYSGIHREIAEYLVHITKLPDIKTPILEIGAGTGILTAHLGKYYSKNQIVCLDISKEMLSRIQAKDLTENCIQADFHCLPFSSPFFFVLSNTALHWASDIESIVNILDQSLARGGIFAIAIMLDETYQLLKTVKSELGCIQNDAVLPNYKTLHNTLLSSGFLLSHAEKKYFTETFNSIDEVFSSINRLGVSGLTKTPLSRGILKSIKNRYLAACIKKYSKPCLEYQVGFYVGSKL